jgi:hypothetical protein
MTRPITSSKVVLVEDRRAQRAAEDAAPVRRYRLARMQLGARSSEPGSRFDHIKRVYD